MPINQVVCQKNDLIKNSGVCALINGEQVAIFYLPKSEQKIFAISNWDPIGKANVLSRGIVGDLDGRFMVASPLYKQHFDLITGECLEDALATVKTYTLKLEGDNIILNK